MKSISSSLALLTAFLATATGFGADLVLREKATQHGAIIRLGDIADISAESPAEMKSLAGIPLLPAPSLGTQQFLSVAQIRDLLTSRGVRLNQLDLQGALVVELGAASQSTRSKPDPRVPSPQNSSPHRRHFQKPQLPGSGQTQPPLTQAELTQSIQLAIEQYVIATTHHDKWRVEVLLDKRVIQRISKLTGALQAGGPSKIRQGRQRFLLSGSSGSSQLPVFASVVKIQSVVVAKQEIERGQIVHRTDVEIREREGNLPSNSLTDIQWVLGKEAQRVIRAEQVLLVNQVRAPMQVQRGETVNVFVRTGGIVVRTRAIAKEAGAMGDLIALETLEGKRRLDGSISGPGEVNIYATGGRATDYASLSRNESRRR